MKLTNIALFMHLSTVCCGEVVAIVVMFVGWVLDVVVRGLDLFFVYADFFGL